MRLMGFNFTKINVERLGGSGENLKINTNIDISEIEKAKVDFFKGKEEILSIKFKYNINYDPEFAKIIFEGNIIITVDSKQSKELLLKWKNKEVLPDVQYFIFNIIIRKANIKALQFEDEMNLPLHIPMPRLSKQNKENN